MSLSSIIRNQGNEYFRQACESINVSLQKTRELYEKALSRYYKAKEKAENPEDDCSASKNIGKAAWRTAGVLIQQMESCHTILHYQHEAIKGFCAAYNGSEDCKPMHWRNEIQSTLSLCLEEVVDLCDVFHTDMKISQVERLVMMTTVDRATADLQLRLARLYFNDGASKLQNGDYKACLSRMRDCYRPIEEVKRLAHITGDELGDLLLEGETLERDVLYHTCSASSMQARLQGDHLLSLAIEDEEELDMTLIFEVIDWYKQAVLLAREIEIEQEAIAESRLGVVYDKVLKMKNRAKDYFSHSLQLVESMKPRIFTSCDWYKECISALQRYQEEVRQRDEEAKRQVRAKYLLELKDELEDIKKNNTSAVALIKHVYSSYPPKSTTWEKPSYEEMTAWDSLERGTKEYKKLLVKALAVFHPDKVDDKEHGMKWKVLSEEITKMITNYYENTKFSS
ncbi:uncharacterized protein [Montipora capricornis]|uniref:uncharacterized protein n=1 Tax=Montipora capricornis TaxID=246305 RepID=UPI0035F20CDA